MRVRRRTGRALAVVLIAVAAVVAAELLSGSSGGDRRSAPALPTAVLVPPRATLASLRGRPAAINFWASWCEECRHEAPQLERLARSLHGWARLVGVDWDDAVDGARSFVRQSHWTFPVLLDARGTVGERYGLVGLPTTFILDPQGRITAVLRGPQTAAGLRRALRAAG